MVCQAGLSWPALPSPRAAQREGTPRVAAGSSASLGQALAEAALVGVECRALVGLGVEPALADLFAAIAQARADFALRQRVAFVVHPVTAAAISVAMAVVAAVPVAGRRPRWRPRGRFELGHASCRARGCQYVSLTVVAVSLRQKTDNGN